MKFNVDGIENERNGRTEKEAGEVKGRPCRALCVIFESGYHRAGVGLTTPFI